MLPTAVELKTILDGDQAFFTPSGADDLQGDGYVSTPHLVNLLTGSYSAIENPTPQQMVATHFMLQDVTLGKLFGLTRGTAICTWLSANQPYLLKWLGDTGVDMSLPEVPADLSALVAAGGITQPESDILLALGSQPDPTRQPTIPAPSKLRAAGFDGEYRELMSLVKEALNR